MRLLLHRPLRKLSFLSSASGLLMGSKQAFKSTPFSNPLAPSSPRRPLHSHGVVFSALPSKPMPKTRALCLRTNGYSYVSHADVRPPVVLEKPEEPVVDDDIGMVMLKDKLEAIGIDGEICTPGQHDHLICPMCKGGDSVDKSLSVYIEGGKAGKPAKAVWQCFRGKCGWKGSTAAFAESRSSHQASHRATKLKEIREITVESIGLEPLCQELFDYLAERLLSRETLMRNRVMQKTSAGGQISIAFPYWRDGKLVSCKYRDIDKNFRQVFAISDTWCSNGPIQFQVL